jgi:Uncharacterised nucleotidyltransferase
MSDESNSQIAALQMLSAETQALIAGLRGYLPSRDLELDWATLCQLAAAHRVAPLLHQAWEPFADRLPPAVLSDLTMLRRQSRKQGLLGLRQRDEVLRTLSEADVTAIVLKGGAWARRWYTDISLRPFNDIDLLLSIHDMDHARDALFSAGYRHQVLSEGETGMFHHGMPLEHPNNPCSIELHRQLLVYPTPQVLRFEDVFDRSIVFVEKGAHVRSLDPVDTLIHLCMHLLQHVESNPGWSLLNVWDVVRHLDACEIDWELFDRRANEVGVASACRASLGLVAVVTGAAIPRSHLDTSAGNRLIAFPILRYSLTPTYHRSILSFFEVLSRRDFWQLLPTLREALSRRMKKRTPNEGASATPSLSGRFTPLPLRAFPQEILWVCRESLRSGIGHIQRGIRQIRWEEQASVTVHEIVSGSVESSAKIEYGGTSWPTM